MPAGERYRLAELSPQRRKEKTLEALVDQLGRLATLRPVLLVFEDLHWVEPTSLELLTLMVQRLQRWRVLAVIASRPEFVVPWLGLAHVTSIALRRLNERESTVFVEQIAGGRALPNELLQQILARTDGVPLFLEEITKAVLESDVLREQNGQYLLARPLLPQAVPATLNTSLGARLDRNVHEPQITQMCAAIGREFSYSLLRSVAHPLSEDGATAPWSRLLTSRDSSSCAVPQCVLLRSARLRTRHHLDAAS